MKLISREDLMIVVPRIQNRDSYDLKDFDTILEAFGDDYFFQDGQLVRTKENEKMKRIRMLVKESEKPMIVKEIYDDQDIINIISEYASRNGDKITDIRLYHDVEYQGYGPTEHAVPVIKAEVVKQSGTTTR